MDGSQSSNSSKSKFSFATAKTTNTRVKKRVASSLAQAAAAHVNRLKQKPPPIQTDIDAETGMKFLTPNNDPSPNKTSARAPARAGDTSSYTSTGTKIIDGKVKVRVKKPKSVATKTSRPKRSTSRKIRNGDTGKFEVQSISSEVSL